MNSRILVALGFYLILTALSCAPETSNQSGQTLSAPPLQPIKVVSLKTSLLPTEKVTLTSSGGTGPYSFRIASGEGTLTQKSENSAQFAAGHLGSTEIEAIDSRNMTGKLSIEVVLGKPVSPNDALFAQLINLDNSSSNVDIDAPEAWGLHHDCSSVLVGILDTGVDYEHPDLKGSIYVNPGEAGSKSNNDVDDDGNGLIDDDRGWNFVDENRNANDDNYHGTHVAGVIGAVGNNGIGVAGLCWKASLLPLKFLDENGEGYTSDAIAAIKYGMKMGVKVFNASFGGGNFSQTFQDTLDEVTNAGALFVTSAGNDSTNNDSTPTYPASYQSNSVISVAAVLGLQNKVASFSNYGQNSVHIGAPGSNILSTVPTVSTAAMTSEGISEDYDSLSGTSMAAPHVSGVAALIMSLYPSITASQVKTRILNNSITISDFNNKIQKNRKLNAKNALYGP